MVVVNRAKMKQRAERVRSMGPPLLWSLLTEFARLYPTSYNRTYCCLRTRGFRLPAKDELAKMFLAVPFFPVRREVSDRQ